MSKVVIDASVAIKWVIEEEGTADALALLEAEDLATPDLLVAECANILWKKVRREELLRDEAIMAARLLQGVDIEIFPTRHVLKTATSVAIDLDHPAYDCIYLALALNNGWQFVTADERLQRKLRQTSIAARFKNTLVLLAETAEKLSPDANRHDR